MLKTQAQQTQLQFYPMSNRQASAFYMQQMVNDLEAARARVDPHKQRITQTNMVYLIGVPQWMANEQMLRSEQYCGQYGEIVKTMVKKNYFNQLPSYSAYITYSSDQAACLAVLGVNNMVFDRNRIYASYGTNKYCAQFIKFGKCRKQHCPFSHQIAIHKQIYQDDNKKIFQGQQDLAKSYFLNTYHSMTFDKESKAVFPTPYQILQTFISEGTIILSPQTSQSQNKSDCCTQIQSSSSQSFQQEVESLAQSIQQRIFHKLSVTKSSLFRFVSDSQKKEARRIGDFMKLQIQPMVLAY